MTSVIMPKEMSQRVLNAACRAFVKDKEGEGSTAAIRYAKPMARVYDAIYKALSEE